MSSTPSSATRKRRPETPYSSPEFKDAVRSVMQEEFKRALDDSLEDFRREYGEKALREHKAELGIA